MKEFSGILTQPVVPTTYFPNTPMTALPTAIAPGMYKQIIVRLEYTVQKPMAGVHFVGCEPGDNVLPCQFVTYESDIPISIRQMTLYPAQRVHGFPVSTDYGNGVLGKWKSLSLSV